MSDSRQESLTETFTEQSIPEAHREYEKILRQLEAECRNHIRCEQQMKLHIECLQEKIDNMTKDMDKLKETEKKVNTLQKEVLALTDSKTKIREEHEATKRELADSQTQVSQLDAAKSKL